MGRGTSEGIERNQTLFGESASIGSLQKHKPFKLYLSADERAIGSALIQEFEGKNV